MTNLDGLAVLLFVINSATGNGLAALHFCLNICRLIALLTEDRADAGDACARASGSLGCPRAPRAPVAWFAPETRYDRRRPVVRMRVTLFSGALTLNPADAALRFLAHSAQRSPLFQICKARLLLCDGRLSRTRLQ